jgi:hypothetical protein
MFATTRGLRLPRRKTIQLELNAGDIDMARRALKEIERDQQRAVELSSRPPHDNLSDRDRERVKLFTQNTFISGLH